MLCAAGFGTWSPGPFACRSTIRKHAAGRLTSLLPRKLIFSDAEEDEKTHAGKLVPLLFGQDEPVLEQESSSCHDPLPSSPSCHDPLPLVDPAASAAAADPSYVHALRYVHARDKSYVTAQYDGKQKLRETCRAGALLCFF